MQLDFIARRYYYLDHLKPIWDALPDSRRGNFWLPASLFNDAAKIITDLEKHFTPYTENEACGNSPILAAAYGDAVRAADANSKRPTILIEHGIGLTFGKAEYTDGLGQRAKFAMMPVQSDYILNKVNPELRHIPHPVVGVPKLDQWAGEFSKDHPMPEKPTIAIAFHHGDKNSRPAEIGSAWEHYIDFLPELAKRYKVILHVHPMVNPYTLYGDLINQVEYVPDFDDVMRRADVLLNDCSSATYEFLVTGKPVILLNAPWFDRRSKWGIRFWDYTDIGLQVDDPGEPLLKAIEQTMRYPDEFKPYRSKAVSALFPFIGHSTDKMMERALTVVDKYKLAASPAKPQPIQPAKKIVRKPARKSMERGIIYMAFGLNAWNEAIKSINSLRGTGCDLPVAVVGDALPEFLKDGITFIKWTGISPFNQEEHRVNFKFHAGIVKTELYTLSPYSETMYVDADTEFIADPEVGFNHLKNWDFCIAQEPRSVNELYNEPNPRHWIHDLPERDLTVEEMGSDGNFPMINSGIFLWRKNLLTEGLFSLWSQEWLRFQKWDEQKALWRALERSRVRLFLLSEGWNTNDREQAVMIYHKYGQCAARSNEK